MYIYQFGRVYKPIEEKLFLDIGGLQPFVIACELLYMLKGPRLRDISELLADQLMLSVLTYIYRKQSLNCCS